ncbi:MAG: glycosyltransferase family 4 protein, partial [Deltaproteobacteria bacterium]|nr:glycosyltransferase family 4 protein [Deltaproteobacteria bacterium]
MDVLIASHLYPSAVSRTAGSFVHNQARFLRERVSLRCVAPVPWWPLPWPGRWGAYHRLPDREVIDGIEVRRPRYLLLPRRWLFGCAWRTYLGALERAATPADVLHAHCAYPDGLAAVHGGRRTRTPVVITVHGHDLKDLGSRGSPWRRRVAAALAGADAVI